MTFPIVTPVWCVSFSYDTIATTTVDVQIFVSMSQGACGTPWWSQLQLAAVRTQLSVDTGATVPSAKFQSVAGQWLSVLCDCESETRAKAWKWWLQFCAARQHLVTPCLFYNFDVQIGLNRAPVKGIRQNENNNHDSGIESVLFLWKSISAYLFGCFPHFGLRTEDSLVRSRSD